MKQGQPRSRWRRNLWIAGGLLVAFTVFGFFLAPPIIKAQLEKRATAALGRTVTVGKVRVNPYAMSLTLENLDMRMKEGDGSFLGWSRLYVNFDPVSSLVGAWTLGTVELDGFHAAAVLRKDGRFNFDDIVTRLRDAAAKSKSDPDKPAPAVRIGVLRVQQARLEFTDESRVQPFATTVGPAGFTLEDFHTTKDRLAPYYFEAVTEAGEKLVWSGSLSAAPLASAGELRLENIRLPKYAPYYAERLQADFTSGQLSVSGHYEAKLDGVTRILKLANGRLQLRELKVVERANQEPMIELPTLDVSGIDADALALKTSIATVALEGGRLRVRREADGTINLLHALRPSAPEAEPAAGAPTSPPRMPEFMIGVVALKDFAVDVTDLAAPRPAQLGLTGIQFSLKNVTLAEGAEMPLQLALGWTPTGSVNVSGTIGVKPQIRARLQTDVTSLALLPLSPYIEQFVNARITRGSFATSGAVQVVPHGDTLSMIFEGGANLDNFGLVDGVHNEELAGFASLVFNGLTVVAEPQLDVSLSEIQLSAPYGRVLVNKDGSLNLATLVNTAPVSESAGEVAQSGASRQSGHKAPPAGEPAASEPNAASTTRHKITIAKVVITGGDFSLADRSLEPNVRTAITQFGGTIAGLSSENEARASAELKATVDGAGPIAITGELNPLGAKKFMDLKVDFKNVDLQPFSPYSGKYAGYELARGQLNLDVKAKLDDRALDATNVITLNQFTFGAPVASPVATKLPVRLGVALLKDADGRIVIDVPMSGNIDDPSLRIGKVVMRVVGNLLTKAATSPFALLGSMFGGGGEELAFQEFAPGESELLPKEKTKLETMTKAMANRPGLSLAIEGSADAQSDTAPLKQKKLSAWVRNKIWEERRAADPNIAPPEQLEIPPEAHAAMVRKLFDGKFPSETEAAAETEAERAGPRPSASVVAPPPTDPKRSLFRRVVDALTPGDTPVAQAQPAEPKQETGETVATGPSLEEMTARLTETMEVTENDLRALAGTRAQRVRDYFLSEGQIAADRLFLAQGNTAVKENKGPRVFLSLQ
jgi:hypothetical protein